MKRYNNLLPKIADVDNLYLAHFNARKGKSHYAEVKMVNSDPDKYILDIQNMLLDGSFTTSPYRTQEIFEPKQRTIYKLPYFPDRIVQHAIMQVIQPIWDNIFIYDLYSAIPGRGLHRGSYRLRSFLKDTEHTQYCLKFDVTKFYPSVNHELLYLHIEKKIKCKRTLDLLWDIIDSTDGIPIGNYLSQYFGNIYLNEFDHWIKENKSRKYYLRYCDDGVILGKSNQDLKDLLWEMQEYLHHLNMHLNGKTKITEVDKTGIDFLGYVHYRDKVLLRKSSKRNLVKRMKYLATHETSPDYFRSSIASTKGWLKHCNGSNLEQKYIRPVYDSHTHFYKY